MLGDDTCPLAFDSNTCSLPQFCENYHYCRIHTLSWSLPYRFDDVNKVLLVAYSPACYYTWKPSPVDGVSSGGVYYPELSDSDFSLRIKTAWQEAGWFCPVQNPNYVK